MSLDTTYCRLPPKQIWDPNPEFWLPDAQSALTITGDGGGTGVEKSMYFSLLPLHARNCQIKQTFAQTYTHTQAPFVHKGSGLIRKLTSFNFISI